MKTCADCPDIPNGTRKRAVCCRRSASFKIGQVVPIKPPKLSMRPAFTGPGKTSFKPARSGRRRAG